MRRLVLCLDGTWNSEKSFTNVWRLHIALKRSTTQLVYYDQGVGSAKLEALTGGALGQGLSRNVLRAYLWLTEHYRPDDEIFVFGFSRGAYTARSLVGFLSTCGLLAPDAPFNIEYAFEVYRHPGVTRDSSAARELRRTFALGGDKVLWPKVCLVGVFDTVGALGVPGVQLPLLENYHWHKVHLSPIVEHAYHAVAIDEHRELFNVALWCNRYPWQTVEQRWFPGAHANVGGGYERDPLSIRPLEWMQQRAKSCGLEFDYDPCQVRDLQGLYAAKITDSWWDFMKGAYAVSRHVKNVLGSPRFYRRVGAPSYWRRPSQEVLLPRRFERAHAWLETARKSLSKTGLVDPPKAIVPGVGEVLDYTAVERVRRNSSYRPPNLKAYFDAKLWGP